MTFSKRFIIDKLNALEGYISELKELIVLDDKEILSDSYKLHSAERLLQLVVDIIIDINQYLIRELKLKMSDDFQGTFHILGDNKILPEDFAKKLAPVVGLRNRVVHRYEKLNNALFIQTLKEDFADFQEYSELIKGYLKNKIG